MNILLISTYEMGRQSFGLASPAAWLRETGAVVTCVDVTRQKFPEAFAATADLVAWYLPMHTATRLAVPFIQKVKALNSRAHLCCYGLYATLNTDYLTGLGVKTVLGGEFESDLVSLVAHLNDKKDASLPQTIGTKLSRLDFRVPDREGLPALSTYASLTTSDGLHRVVGYTEASRGCKHLCRHCPIVPVYQGRFRIVSPQVVLADIRNQVEAGARHITFGDPDFFNGIRHAMSVVEGLNREHPDISYDVTIKIEHLLTHADCLHTLRETGCLFVTSAVESLDDKALLALDKGHTRADFEKAVHLCADAELALAPTFIAFTPWTTLTSYCELLESIATLGLIDAVAPIQLGIRLLITRESRLLTLPEIKSLIGPYDSERLIYPWLHPDPRVDALHEAVMQLIGSRPSESRSEIFDAIWTIAHERSGLPITDITHSAPMTQARAAVPYLNEPWYC